MRNRFIDENEQTEELLKPKNLINKIENKITSSGQKFLFIIDNVKKQEEIRDVLKILRSHEFIIITRNKNIFMTDNPEGKNYIEVQPFDENSCMKFLEINRVEMTPDEEKNWRNMIKQLIKNGNAISPKNFEIAVNKYKNRTWDLKEVEKYLRGENISENEFKENENEFEILKHLAYLNGNYIDYDLIRKIFYNLDNLDSTLEQLVSSGFLKKNPNVLLRNAKFEMHETTQKEIIDKISKMEEKKQIINKIIVVLNESIPEETNEKIDKRKENLEKLEKINMHSIKIIQETEETERTDEEEKNYF